MARRTQDGRTEWRLFPLDPFGGFGPSRFRPAGEEVVSRGIRSRRGPTRLHRGVKDHAPRKPGVYGMLDARGRVIYVGKAKDLRARLMCYFRENSRDPKAGRILDHTRTLVWEETADEFAALLRELELIQGFRPRFNVLGQPGNASYHYICLGRQPAPYAYVAKTPTGKELGVYGPLVKRYRSEDACRRINDWFRLRDCAQTVPMAFADQAELFPAGEGAKCLRFELNTCPGPCVGACTRKEYGAGVRAAKAFLDGRDRTPLAKLRAMMQEASDEFRFERAMSLRDRLTDLERLDARLSLLRTARGRQSFIYPLSDAAGRERWYLLHRGQVRGVVYPPDTDDARRQVAAQIDATFVDSFVEASHAMPDGTVDSILLVSAWFKKNADERPKLFGREDALRRCVVVDAGGPGDPAV